MQSIELQSRAGADGVLHLDVPAAAPNADYDVLVILRPRAYAGSNGSAAERGWLPGFLAQTAGAWQGESLIREAPGDFELRDSLP